jgi:hypothetical protein
VIINYITRCNQLNHFAFEIALVYNPFRLLCSILSFLIIEMLSIKIINGSLIRPNLPAHKSKADNRKKFRLKSDLAQKLHLRRTFSTLRYHRLSLTIQSEVKISWFFEAVILFFKLL